MASKSLNYYLTKLVRVTGWLLLALMTIYIVTGFSLCGKLGVSAALDPESALVIHKIFDWPLVAVFLLHSSLTVYFAMRRWGWIRTAPKSRS